MMSCSIPACTAATKTAASNAAAVRPDVTGAAPKRVTSVGLACDANITNPQYSMNVSIASTPNSAGAVPAAVTGIITVGAKTSKAWARASPSPAHPQAASGNV